MRLRQRITFLFVGLLFLGSLCLLGSLYFADLNQQREQLALQRSVKEADQEKKTQTLVEKGHEVLKPQAVQINERLTQALGRLQKLADQPELKALLSAKTKFSPSKKQEKFTGIAKFAQEWSGCLPASVLFLSEKGRVLASWPKGDLYGSDKSELPVFKNLSQEPGLAGQAILADYEMDPVVKKGVVILVCGLASPAKTGKLGGLLEIRITVENLMEASTPVMKTLSVLCRPAIPAMMMVRGNGPLVFYTSEVKKEKAFKEDFSLLNKDLLAQMNKVESAFAPMTYDGAKGILVWNRVMGQSGDPGVYILNLAAFFPLLEAGSAATGATGGKTALMDPLVLALAAVGVFLPLLLGLIFAGSLTSPLKRTIHVLEQVEEGQLEYPFPLESIPDYARLNSMLEQLSGRLKEVQDRLAQREDSVQNLQEQVTRTSAQSAAELSETRAKVANLEAEKQNLTKKTAQLETELKEARTKASNAATALEASQKNLEQKNTQNNSLSAQLQEALKGQEEQKVSMRNMEEKASHRGIERVRLEAINSLSSELKSILSVIKGYISNILGTSGAISNAQQEFLGVVINKSARLERLIADLLDLSQVESGVAVSPAATINPATLIRELLINAQVQADTKKISFDLGTGAAASDVVADQGRLAQVLNLLLSQAIKVTSRGEKVSVFVGDREGTVEIRITDPGMSLPPDRAARVFTQFHGVDSQAGPEFIGTGLRFPIIKSIVETLGGKLWIESQVGKGKTFIISLPRAGSPGAMKPGAMSMSSASSAALKPSALPTPPPGPAVPKPAPSPPAAKPPSFSTVAPPAAGLPPIASKPSAAMPAAAGLPPVNAAKGLSQNDIANFEKIFGGAPSPGAPKPPSPSPPPPASPALPKVSAGPSPVPAMPAGAVKPPAKSLSQDDIANFEKIFGGAPSPGAPKPPSPTPPPPAPSKESAGPAPAPKAPSALPPVPAPLPVPKVPVAPLPPMPAGLPPLPVPAGAAGTVGKGLSQDDISNFEAIFGGEAKSPVTPFPPAGPKPLPGIPGGPPVPQGIPGGIKSPAPLPSLGFALNPLPAPPAKSGGMGSLTDLTSMIQKSPVAPPLAKDKAAGKDELVE